MDAYVLSCEVGSQKPDPAIFKAACERLGASPEDIPSWWATTRRADAGAAALGCTVHLVDHGAMTPGVGQETADGMAEEKIDAIITAMRHERYRFSPVRRTHIPKKNGKLRPLGLPTWSDKLVGEVVRLLLEAYYEPSFSDSSRETSPTASELLITTS